MVKNYINKVVECYKFWHIGLSEWRCVIHALIYRETKTLWGSHSLGIIWAFIEPITHVFILTLLRIFLKGGVSHEGELSVFLFIATGIFPFFVFKNTFNTVKSSISANRALLAFPQIHILDFIFARSILVLMTYSVSFLIFTLALSWYQDPIEIVNMMNIIKGFLLMWAFGVSCGILCLPLAGKFKIIDELISVVLRIAYFVSGVMFSFTDIPTKYHPYLEWIPTFHGIEYVRSGFSHIYGEFADIQYLLYVVLISLPIGMFIIKKNERYILNGR